MKCRVFCTVADGKITRIANAMGISDKKGEAAKDLICHPDRLKYPLRRIGKRGEGGWQRISWDEALTIMAEKVGLIKEQYGPEAIATIWASGHKVMASAATFMFSQVVETPNILDINQQCDLPLDMAQATTFGENILSDQMPHFTSF